MMTDGSPERIDEIFVWVTVAPDGKERLVAEFGENGWRKPALSLKRSDTIDALAQEQAELTGMPVKLRRFILDPNYGND